MKVIIIEDEPPAARKLTQFLKRYNPRAEVAATLSGVHEIVFWLGQNHAPDLIFSDIELLDGNVFEVFERAEISCPVIFTTAYDQFWMQAFERNGIAYLLKPFTFEKFAAAMRKFETLRQNFTFAQTDFWHELRAKFSAPRYKERFVLKVRGGIQFVETAHIAFIQIQNEITFAFDRAGHKFPLGENLTQLEQTLDPKIFFRLNRSEIVNLNFIERLEPDFQECLVVKIKNSNVKLVSSTSRTPALRKWLEG